MNDKIVVGAPLTRGLRNDVTPFNIDNESFPVLINAYQWRGRVKRKRGTSLLGRLTRFFNSLISTYNSGSSTITLGNDGLGNGTGNLLTGFTSLETNGEIVLGNITINDTTNGATYTDPDENGTLRKNGSADPGSTINYSTGAFVLAGRAGDIVNASFTYNPDLPVLGIEDLVLIPTQFPGTLAFDTKYSYNITTAFPYPIYDVSFYKNPTAGLPGYTPKTTWTPTTWNGQDYQQYWSVNYQGAFWVTNGINVPFSPNNIGMQFTTITGASIGAGGPPAIVTLNTTGSPAVVGDFVFINEINGMKGINWQTGYVTAINPGVSITVEFPNATISGAWASGGIIQYLTNRVNITKDCLRWYDGDPTNGSSTNPIFVQGNGWVNFSPPLSQNNISIADLPAAKYYLVGARIIVPFKDRLLFFGPVIQAASGNPIYLQDTIVYSQNGTPYYTSSFTNSPSATVDDPISASITFNPILVPINQTATAPAYFSDSAGFGGFLTVGVSQPIITVSGNEDVLIIGFGNTLQARLVYSGNDIIPFNIFVINSELPSSSTFSVINMDQGVITRGQRGYIITGQTQAQRIDLEIPDEAFEVNLINNGNERFTAQRDFINEWIYFTYPPNTSAFRYPSQTLQYNYRDNSWAMFNESYTTYGQFKKRTGYTWGTVGLIYPTWGQWNVPWNSGSSTLLQPKVLAGNQQGFILERDDGTGEGTSLYIQSFSGVTNIVTSPDHNLSNGDYILITGALGTVGSLINGKIFSVFNIMQNTFQLKPDPMLGTDTYFGGGLITKIYVPFIQTKQFPVAWGLGRKTRIGVQQYLFTTTNQSQITLQIYLSQNADFPYNDPTFVQNNSLIYSTVLFTCPESTNLGLTPANTNLNLITAKDQSQTWHRMNTSLIGDTVQIGFTMSDAQIRDVEAAGIPFPITNITKTNPCVLTCSSDINSGQLVIIAGVVGMTQLNGNTYQVLSSTSTTVTINVDATGFSPYISGGTATVVAGINAFSEIELHGFILNVSPSQLLA